MRPASTPVLLLLLAACGDKAGSDSGTSDDTGTAEDLARTLVSPGPHGAGYVETEVSYADPVAGLPGEEAAGSRTLRLAVWYPSSEETLGEEIRYGGVFLGDDVVEGAAWAEAPAGGFPVAVYSHGHQGYAEASSFVAAHLASHGWVVLAPDHTGNTTFDGSDRETAIYIQRPHDLSAVLDAALEGELSALGGAELDAGAVVALGHSFGGYGLFAAAGASYDAALQAECLSGADTSAYCSTMTEAHAEVLATGFSEPRVAAWLPMAPGDFRLFGAAGLAELETPVVLLSGELDPQVGDNPMQYWEALKQGGTAEHRHLEILGGGHQTFTDFSGSLEDFEGLISAEEADPVVLGTVLAAARLHGQGDATVQPVLDGEITWSAATHWVD